LSACLPEPTDSSILPQQTASLPAPASAPSLRQLLPSTHSFIHAIPLPIPTVNTSTIL
jgi:hypothetical protein